MSAVRDPTPDPAISAVTGELETYRVHRRQFVIGPRPFSEIHDWVVTPVPGAGYLSHCSELRVASARAFGGLTWILLGVAVQSDSARPDPVWELPSASQSSIQDLYQAWAGRWIVVGDGKLHLDAGGLLGCFYGWSGAAPGTGELWASSSPGLLAGILKASTRPLRIIHHKVGFDWYTPPRSRYGSIFRLLPSQILDLSSGEVTPRRLIPYAPATLSYAALIPLLQDYLTTTLRNVAKLAKTTWLPLTGGYDSRLLLATAMHAGISVRPFTLGFRGMAFGDRTLPPRLARAVGTDHTFDWGTAISKGPGRSL